MKPHYRPVIADIREGALAWVIWGRLGWRETRLRYQRTTLGPFWATLSLAIFVTVLGLLWSQLWKQDVKTYMPFLTSGMVTWLFFSAMIFEGASALTGSTELIKQLRISYTLLACSVVWRNLIVFGHNLIIYVAIFIFSGLPLTWAHLLVVPGLLLLSLNGIWMSLVLGLACARYRDIQQLIQSLMQVAMFLTPIFWSPDQLQGKAKTLLLFHPLYHYVEIVRAPLMGDAPALWSWIFVGLMTLSGWGLVFVLYARFRQRIAYWL